MYFFEIRYASLAFLVPKSGKSIFNSAHLPLKISKKILTSGGFGGVLYNIIYYIYIFLSHTTALKNVLHLIQLIQWGGKQG